MPIEHADYQSLLQHISPGSCTKHIGDVYANLQSTISSKKDRYLRRVWYIYADTASTERRKVLGKKHPDTLTSTNSLAWVLQDQIKYAETGELYRQTLKEGREVLSEKYMIGRSVQGGREEGGTDADLRADARAGSRRRGGSGMPSTSSVGAGPNNACGQKSNTEREGSAVRADAYL